MIKLFFIIAGLSAILYALLRFFVSHVNNADTTTKPNDGALELEKCPYCGDYVPQKPHFEHGKCNICAKKRVDS